MKNNEIKNLSFIRVAFANGIMMFLIVLLSEALKGSINFNNSEIFEAAIGYVFLNTIVYVYGVIVLIVLFLELKSLKEFNQIYFFISIVIFGILCFLWLPHYNLITTFFKGATLSSTSNMDDVFGIAQSAYNGLRDISALNTGMYMFFANGMFHWAVRYFEIFKKDENIIEKSISANVGRTVINTTKEFTNSMNNTNNNHIALKENVDLSIVYSLMNESSCINKSASKYWMFSFESIFLKENEVNKRYLRIKLFNKDLDEDNNLMRLYLKINGEEVYQDYFKIDDVYQNSNFLVFDIERDLAEEKSIIEMTGYIADGKKVILGNDKLEKIDIVNNSLRLEMIKEFFFKENENKCHNIPIVHDNYWVCSCGIYHTDDMKCAHCGKTKTEVIEMLHFNEQNLLQNLSDTIEINIEEDMDKLKQKAINKYADKYGLDRNKIANHINKDVLFLRQKKLVDDTIRNIIRDKPIKYDMSLNFEKNLENYALQEAIGIISKNMILDALDVDKCQLDYKMFIDKKNKKKKDKIRLEIIFGISAVLIISAIIVSRKNMTEFKINKFNYILEIYDTQKIQMKNFNNDIEFESSNEDIVTVSPEGEMTGLNEGKTSIIVYDYVNEEEYELNITVVDNSTDDDYIDEQDNDSMIFPDSDCVYLVESDLEGLSQWELRIARNEIYARRGCVYTDEELKNYFESCSWYHPIGVRALDGNDLLNEIEKANAKFIRDYEKKKGYLK